MITYPLNNIEYSAEDAELYACTRSSGVFSGDDFTVTCTGTNNNVTVGVGVGWIHNTRFSGKVFANKTAETLKLSVADAIYPRIDAVAIRFDASANSTSLVIKDGTPAEEPTLPDIVQTESVYELYIASVYREAGAAAVTQGNITDIRLDESVCGLMRDGVTAISTEGLQAQYYAVLEELKSALDRVRDSGTSAEFIPISDLLAEKLGIDTGASVEDAFVAIEEGVSAAGSRVGDIKITVRTDLGDDWLLCNGMKVSREVYEALGEQIPASLAAAWTDKSVWQVSSGASAMINCIIYTNGYWVVGGVAGSAARIAYTADIEGEWTTKDIWSSTSPGNTINCIAYANGTWVVGGMYYYSNRYARIAYATDLAVNWTTKDLWNSSSSTTSTINCIAYADGRWVVGGQKADSAATIAYASNPSEAWTTKDAWTGNGNYASVNCIAYANGYWVAGGYTRNSTIYYATTAYANYPGDAWTVSNLWTVWNGSSGNNSVRCITYADGYWVVGGSYLPDGGTHYARIAYTNDIAGVWTTKDVWSGDAFCPIYCIAYAEGLWAVGGIAGGAARIAHTADIEGEWTTKEIWTSAAINGITYVGSRWVVGGRYTAGSNNNAAIAFIDTGLIQLPEISVDGSYAYIKAKE